jgi:hypothetical protein
MTELRAVPDLDTLLREPERVADLDPAEVKRLAPQLAMLVVAMLLRSAPAPMLPPPPDDPVWLNAQQVEARFGLAPGWLHEHRKELQRLGLVSQPSRKSRLYDFKRLRSYIEHRRTSPG